MAASSNVAIPIIPKRVLGSSDANAQTERLAEKSGQTFLQGTPVQVDVAGGTGFLINCPAMTSVATAIIAGFSQEPGHNLTTSGTGSGPGGTPGGVTYAPGSVPNQPNAVLIVPFGPIYDGTVGINVAINTTWFFGVVGNSNTAANATLAQTMIGAIFGLTKDAGNNFWYVDNYITTAATGACVEVMELYDPVGTLNGHVLFRVTQAAQQFSK